MKDYKIGIQLYTIREALKEDFTGCLRELAAMGYEGVEFAGNYGGMTPEQLAEFLRETGLAVCGMHLPLAAIMDSNHEAYRYAKAVGCRYLITSLAKNFAEEIEQRIVDCSKAGEVAAGQGLSFAYHNHAHEFIEIDGKRALDCFYAATTANLVKAELDTFWIATGGEEPVAYLKKYAERLPLIHLKDMDRESREFTEVGSGIMDLQGILDVAVNSAAEWVIYEQDHCKRPSMESARISIVNLRKAMQR